MSQYSDNLCTAVILHCLFCFKASGYSEVRIGVERIGLCSAEGGLRHGSLQIDIYPGPFVGIKHRVRFLWIMQVVFSLSELSQKLVIQLSRMNVTSLS